MHPDPTMTHAGEDLTTLKGHLEGDLGQELIDAQELLDFALSTGRLVPKKDGEDLEKTIVSPINDATHEGLEKGRLDVHRIEFQVAYARLASLLAPVTISTLRATAPERGRRSEARRWSQTLWWITGITCFVVFGTDTLGRVLLDGDRASAMFRTWQNGWDLFHFWMAPLIPFGYGTIGSCAYLLRSCHDNISKRTFDPLRKPEYLNRILLGAIAGGTILLFTAWLAHNANGTGAQLGGAALAFLAGYNTDLLFRLLENVKDALVPAAVERKDKPGAPTTTKGGAKGPA